MTDNSYYLNALDRYIKIQIDRNWFYIYLDYVCRKVAETYDLFDYRTVVDSIFNNDIGLDAAKAAGIWFLQATDLYKPNESLSTYIAALNDFDTDYILIEFAVGWIWQNIGTEGFLRDMILRNPMCNNVKKLWRWYDFLNVRCIKYYGSPMIYSSDKYSPLVNIFSDTQMVRADIDAIDYEYDDIACNSLFIIYKDESNKTKSKKIQFIENIYRAIFLDYAHYFARWIENEDSVMYPLPNDLLLNGLYLIRKASSHLAQTFEIETEFEDYSDDMLESIDVYYKKKMSEFPDKTLLSAFNNWLIGIKINYYDGDTI